MSHEYAGGTDVIEIQFEMYRDGISGVRSQPSVPPETTRDDYIYDPTPPELMPPIGSNILVHFFENPQHSSVLPDLYRRIPKKLRKKLIPCQWKGSAIGWGIQFVEGLNTFLFFICGCGGFLLCFLVALAWTIAKDDIQGGFGLGAFLLTFMAFCGGIILRST